jgi:hypothetical protein
VLLEKYGEGWVNGIIIIIITEVFISMCMGYTLAELYIRLLSSEANKEIDIYFEGMFRKGRLPHSFLRYRI